MKIGLNFSADSISVLALNMGKIAVEVDGVGIAELMNAVNAQGLSQCIADEPGKVVVENPLPAGSRPTGVCCSTAHIPAKIMRCCMRFLTRCRNTAMQSGYISPARVTSSG